MFKVPKDEDIQAVLEAYDLMGKTAEKVRYVVLMLVRLYSHIALYCLPFCPPSSLPPSLPYFQPFTVLAFLFGTDLRCIGRQTIHPFPRLRQIHQR